VRWLIPLLLIACTSRASGGSLPTAVKKKTLVDLAAIVEEAYVYPDAAKRIAGQLRALAAREADWRNDDADAFAKRVTTAMRSVVVDSHLGLQVRRPSQPGHKPETEAQVRERLRRRNFDVVAARSLRGSAGYLDIRSLPPPTWVGDTLQAAIGFIANADAIIIDLRQNGGGAADTVALLAGYFFAKPTHILTSTHRRRGETKVMSVATNRALPDVDVYLLTSHQTFSAAEAFVYALQGHHRAIVVGDPTGGGANAGDLYTLNDVFEAFVPDASGIHPVTKTNWEATGVVPDLPCAADDALTVAHAAALKALAARTADPSRRNELVWALQAIESRAAPTDAELKSLAGQYGTRRVWIANGLLHYQVATEPVQVLQPITNQKFMFATRDSEQLDFEPNALVLRHADGTTERFARGAR
jgi:retinol-binding protein 3